MATLITVEKIKEYNKIKKHLFNELSREPLDYEIATEMNVEVDVIHELELLRVDETEVDEMSHNLRFKLTIKNNEMEKARERTGLLQQGLSDITGISVPTLSAIECCRSYPDLEKQEKITKALGSTKEQLFPLWLKMFSMKWNKKEKSRIVPINQISLDNPEVLFLGDGSYERTLKDLDSPRLWDRIKKLGLSDKEIFILKHRFGFEDTPIKTYDEIAKLMGVTRERIRQIEGRVLEIIKSKYTDILL